MQHPGRRRIHDVTAYRLVATLAAMWIAAAAPCRADSRSECVSRLRSSLGEAERVLADGDLDRAATFYRQVVREAGELGQTNLLLARATDGLADVHRLAGRPAEAAELYLRAADMWGTLLGPRQPRLALTLYHLGSVYGLQGRPSLAALHLRRALAIWEATLGPDSPQARDTRQAISRFANPSLPPSD